MKEGRKEGRKGEGRKGGSGGDMNMGHATYCNWYGDGGDTRKRWKRRRRKTRRRKKMRRGKRK